MDLCGAGRGGEDEGKSDYNYVVLEYMKLMFDLFLADAGDQVGFHGRAR